MVRGTLIFARRTLAALLLAGMLLPWAPQAAVPVHADHAPDHDPVARLQLIIKKIIIHDDSDWGEGEISFTTELWQCRSGSTNVDDCREETLLVKKGGYEQLADSGDVLTTDWVLPDARDQIADESISEAFGIPVYSGRSYRWMIKAVEGDEFFDDQMGDLYGYLTESEGWSVGTATRRGWRDTSSITGDFCKRLRTEGCSPAQFSVEFEVREVPLPDLRPTKISVLDLPGTTGKTVCMGVQNAGTEDAGAFEVLLLVNGVPAPNGRAEAGRLASGGYGELCVQPPLPQGQPRLAVIVDDRRVVYEQNEANNIYSEGAVPRVADVVNGSTIDLHEIVAEANPGAAQPKTTPDSTARADLTVESIRVRGRVPDGKDDCKDGWNDIVAVVKNVGTSTAGPFVVRLQTGEDDEEKSINGLEANREREVRFEDVRLRKGSHTLVATADAKNAIVESDDGNNARTVSATCSDED